MNNATSSIVDLNCRAFTGRDRSFPAWMHPQHICTVPWGYRPSTGEHHPLREWASTSGSSCSSNSSSKIRNHEVLLGLWSLVPAKQVERAFSQWWGGIYEPLSATLSTFNRNLWGPKTAEYMHSLDHANDNFWTDIIDKAQMYKGRYKAQDQYLSSFMDSRMNGSSGHANVFAS